MRLLQHMRDVLFDDDLFVRVIIFMTGALLLVIPVLAVLFGVLASGSDPALFILLGFFAVLAIILICSSLYGGDGLMKHASAWAGSGELAVVLGLITLAIPITLLIRLLRPRQRNP